jgi:hypothetical protein
MRDAFMIHVFHGGWWFVRPRCSGELWFVEKAALRFFGFYPDSAPECANDE